MNRTSDRASRVTRHVHITRRTLDRLARRRECEPEIEDTIGGVTVRANSPLALQIARGALASRVTRHASSEQEPSP